eukprot:CAMPEP_0119055804 /NCGR_PEP_ID=MMETSP1178-20130426/390_1 /TAXON_ID=33656 /ORGANISM="unid sp, Strain CCMP2000" /LENGTH=139 /DNA_ID=CAMNT_0007036437 /DNA_START=133 /DNA_END=548 /DNA_ORIENTATION=-
MSLHTKLRSLRAAVANVCTTRFLPAPTTPLKQLALGSSSPRRLHATSLTTALGQHHRLPVLRLPLVPPHLSRLSPRSGLSSRFYAALKVLASPGGLILLHLLLSVNPSECHWNPMDFNGGGTRPRRSCLDMSFFRALNR